MASFESQRTEAKPRELRQRLRSFLSADSESQARLRATLRPMREEGWQAFLFGGLLRDLLWGVTPRDVDLVVQDEHMDSIIHWLSPKICHRNRFGGIKVRDNGWEFDIWSVSQTWAFQQSSNWPSRSFADLPATTFLNIEAVAMELWPSSSERRIYENGFYSAFEQQTVEINYADNPYPDFCIARAIFVAAKLRFNIGPELTKYIDAHTSIVSVKDIANIQRKHYKTGLLSEAYLTRLLDHVRWSADWQITTQLDRINHSHSNRNKNPYQLELWPKGYHDLLIGQTK